MSSDLAPVKLAMRLALLSCISFGGFPSVLPDLRGFVVATNGWVTDQLFRPCAGGPRTEHHPADEFHRLESRGSSWRDPQRGRNIRPPCAMYFVAYQLWDRFRDARWQMIVRRGLAPLTIGLVIAGGTVMARTGDAGWQGAALTIAAAGLMIRTRVNPLWVLAAGGAFGGLGLL
jgi:chromate transporter